MIRKKRLSPLTIFALIGFCIVVTIGSVQTCKALILNSFETREETIFVIVFNSLFLFFGILVFRRLLLEYDSTYHLSFDADKQILNIKSKFSSKSIELNKITVVKLIGYQELKSNFKSTVLRDLELSVQTTQNNLLGAGLGASLEFYNKNNLIFKLKNLDNSTNNLEKVLKNINKLLDSSR